MDFGRTLKRLEKATIDNSPAILTAIGITGTITTAYLTGKASIKAVDIVREERKLLNERYQPEVRHALDRKDVLKLTWKLYIPPVLTGIVTVTAIFGANQVNTRRAAAMATAYSISERAFSEYKEKVVEKLGEKKEQSYRDEVAQERVERDPVNDKAVIITDNGDVLCYDNFTGRYFKSSMESIRQAENELNRRILHDGYASLSDLYELLNLDPTSFSDEVGWTDDRLLDIKYSTVMSLDNRPCIAIDFDLRPTRDFAYFAK